MNGIDINDQIFDSVYDSLFDSLYVPISSNLQIVVSNSVFSTTRKAMWNRLENGAHNSIYREVDNIIQKYEWN